MIQNIIPVVLLMYCTSIRCKITRAVYVRFGLWLSPHLPFTSFSTLIEEVIIGVIARAHSSVNSN